MSVRNPYKKKKKTHIDEKLMEKIGWSEEDVISFVKDVEEEEKVDTKSEIKQKNDLTNAPIFSSPPCQKQTVASAAKSAAAKITPEQKAVIHVNRERAYYLRKRKNGKQMKKESKVTKVEVNHSARVHWKDRVIKKKKGEEGMIEEDV